MDINSQQQINTFVGGMNTDTSDAMLDSSQYRDALNLRIVTNTDSNSGELRVVEGTEPIVEVEGEEILKITGVRDYGILITRNTTYDTWSIYRFRKSDPYSLTKLFGPCSTPIWETGEDPDLSVICNYESEKNVKLYIADGIHGIMCINIYNTPQPDPAPYDISFMFNYTDKVLLPLEVSVSEQSGQIYSAKVLYAYRLYSKNGMATKLSPLSKILSLYRNKQNGYSNGSKSGRAVSISLPDITSYIDTNVLTNILIFRINWVISGQEPAISLIRDLKYSQEGSVITDSGSSDIMTISVSEFLSYSDFDIIPKSIETKNNYLFASNLRYKVSEVDNKFKNLKNNLSEYFELLYGDEVYGDEYWVSDTLLDDSYADQHSTYRPGETYRFGVIFYDENGDKSSVFWLDDVTLPDYSAYSWCDLSTYGGVVNSSSLCAYRIHPPAIKIKLKKKINNCSRYEIVRCIRTINDKRTITQGLLGRPLEQFDSPSSSSGSGYVSGGSSTFRLASSGYLSMGDFLLHPETEADGNLELSNLTYAKPASNVLLFASPEYLYQKDDVQELLTRYTGSITVDTVFEFMPSLHSYSIQDVNNQVYISPITNMATDNSFRLKLHYATGQVYLNSDTITYNEDGTWTRSFSRNGKIGHINFNTIFPQYHINSAESGYETNVSYNVQEIAFTEVPDFNSFSVEDYIRFKDDITTIGQYTYYLWSNVLISNLGVGTNDVLPKELKGDSVSSGNWNAYLKRLIKYPIGTNGESILIRTTTPIPSAYSTERTPSGNAIVCKSDGPFLITVADIKKSAVPYGGQTDQAKKNSVYYLFGDNFENLDVDNLNDSNDAIHTLTSGDCYIRMFKYNALHNWFDATYVRANKMGTVYCVPLFMDIDLHGEYGFTYDHTYNKIYYIQDKAAVFEGYTQENNAYEYNTAYNVNTDLIPNSAYQDDEKDTNDYDVRVHYSEQKTNNESIDNWLLFKAMNFLDVDSLLGLITDMKLFKDKLMFWQENASGILAVNERVILLDSNDTQVTLGTGSVLDRYDYISTIYGMKSGLRTACVSNDALYWWDGNNKEILQYVEKYSVTPLSLVKNIRNYINSYTENIHPHVYHNRKYKEIIFQCVGNQSIAYNEVLQRFISRYTFVPKDSVYLEDDLYLVGIDKVYIAKNNSTYSWLFENAALPRLTWVINQNNTITKTYDIQIIGGSLYGGSTKIVDNDNPALFQNQPNVGGSDLGHIYHTIDPLRPISIIYNTSLKLIGEISGKDFTNREYDYRLNIPRENEHNVYGGRLRGKTMQCELSSNSNSTDFSLQYITTKYRMSWS